VQEFLGLTDVEAAIVEMRVRLAEMVLEARRARKVTQRELASRMGSAQPRVVRLEHGDASIEMMLRALVAMGMDRKKIGRLLAAA
jgi:transcriptional regulator with XRE-family HTH domain